MLIERDIAHDEALYARESVLTEEEVQELTPKKKPVKSKNRASQKDKK